MPCSGHNFFAWEEMFHIASYCVLTFIQSHTIKVTVNDGDFLFIWLTVFTCFFAISSYVYHDFDSRPYVHVQGHNWLLN